MSADTIVNLGSKAWSVIDDNKASSDIATNIGTALPQVDDWANLSAPAGTNTMSRRILYFHGEDGKEAVAVNWTLHWEYGATYKKGGAYIPRAWITVDDLDIVWGWNVKLTMQVDPPSNATGDPKRPVARLPLRLTKNVWSMFNITNETEPFNWTIYGDGRIETNGH